MPTVAGANSGLRKTSTILPCSSASVLVEFAVRGVGTTAIGEADGLAIGKGVGEGDASGIREVAGVGVVRRSLWLPPKLATVPVVAESSSKRTRMDILVVFIIKVSLSVEQRIAVRINQRESGLACDLGRIFPINSTNRESSRNASQLGSLSKQGRFSFPSAMLRSNH